MKNVKFKITRDGQELSEADNMTEANELLEEWKADHEGPQAAYRIVREETICTIIRSEEFPLKPFTVEDAVNELIAENAMGSPSMKFYYPDRWDELTEDEKKQAKEEFGNLTCDCADCGWTFEVSEINDDDGELVCSNCLESRQEQDRLESCEECRQEVDEEEIYETDDFRRICSSCYHAEQ